MISVDPKKKTALKKLDSHERRLNLIYGWVKNGNINFGQFKELMAYLEVVDDIKDAEFTEARLKEIKEKEIK